MSGRRMDPVARPVPAKPHVAPTEVRSAPPMAAFAPARAGGGQAIGADLRERLEAAFGRDLGHVRVHDDARAHDAARSLGANAFATGSDIVFGAGRYRPDTRRGTALIAHEVAHVVQQANRPLASGGPTPTDGETLALERAADGAAAAFAAGRPMPALGAAHPGTIQRQPEGEAPAPITDSPAAQAPVRLPPGMKVVRDVPFGDGRDELVVQLDSFALPLEKGIGPWVKDAHDLAGGAGRLVFTPLFNGTDPERVSAFKEGSEKYKKIWLNNFGFSSEKALSDAFLKAGESDPVVATALKAKGVDKTVRNLGKGLGKSGCDIDHIVEKQMGGTSVPSNLQILDATKNRESGSNTFNKLLEVVDAIRAPDMRGSEVRNIQIRLGHVTVPTGTDDPSFHIEDMLRAGRINGTMPESATAGSPLALVAGGVTEVIRVAETGVTPIANSAKRLIPGVRIKSYERGAEGAWSKSDKVSGHLDSLAKKRSGADRPEVDLIAEIATGPVPDSVAAGEMRNLRLTPGANEKIEFYYPYLSPGYLSFAPLDAKGGLKAKGTIKSTVPMLGDIAVEYSATQDGGEKLAVVSALGKDALTAPGKLFRFTEGALELDLMPEFVPRGSIGFEIGPAEKPIATGKLEAGLIGGAFNVTGSLVPAMGLPGIDAAEGNVSYTSGAGWAGSLKAKSSKIRGARVDAEIGFREGDGGLAVFASGGLSFGLGGASVDMKLDYADERLVYSGGATLTDPVPLVKSVALHGTYSEGEVILTGNAGVEVRGVNAGLEMTYRRKDGETGAFSGTGTTQVKAGKATGTITVTLHPDGVISGTGLIAYQLNDHLRPELGVELERSGRIKLKGGVSVDDIPLSPAWPKDGKALNTLFEAGVEMPFPLPPPLTFINATAGISGAVRFGYQLGPIALKEVTFEGSLYPFEAEMEVKAALSGKITLPGSLNLEGVVEGSIGAELAKGAVGVKGKLAVVPGLHLNLDASTPFSADYDKDGLALSVAAQAELAITGTVAFEAAIEGYAAYGLMSHEIREKIAEYGPVNIGPELTLHLGTLSRAKDGTITPPSLSEIRIDPAIDPKAFMKQFTAEGTGQNKVTVTEKVPDATERLKRGLKEAKGRSVAGPSGLGFSTLE